MLMIDDHDGHDNQDDDADHDVMMAHVRLGRRIFCMPARCSWKEKNSAEGGGTKRTRLVCTFELNGLRCG